MASQEETRFVTDAQELDAGELIKEELFILWPSKGFVQRKTAKASL